jgi:hypothetical protein
MEEQPQRRMKLAVTDRHYPNIPADYHLLGSLSFNADAYTVAYQTVMQWNDWRVFDDYDVVMLYLCSRITANLGAIDALDALGITYELLEYLPYKGAYRKVERKRLAKR